MDVNIDELKLRAKKDNIDIELLRSYLMAVEKLQNDPELLSNDEAVDGTLLGFYTWKRCEMIKEAALLQNMPGNMLFEKFEGSMNPGQRRLLETLTHPDPILNYHVAGLVHAGERVREFTARFGVTTPLNKLLKEYVFKKK
jgi:hypothetical protein